MRYAPHAMRVVAARGLYVAVTTRRVLMLAAAAAYIVLPRRCAFAMSRAAVRACYPCAMPSYDFAAAMMLFRYRHISVLMFHALFASAKRHVYAAARY